MLQNLITGSLSEMTLSELFWNSISKSYRAVSKFVVNNFALVAQTLGGNSVLITGPEGNS